VGDELNPIHKANCEELRQRCTRAGLSAKGSKAALIERLKAHFFWARTDADEAGVGQTTEVVGVEVGSRPLLGKEWNSLTPPQQAWLREAGFTSR
jgi:hypothetical protein